MFQVAILYNSSTYIWLEHKHGLKLRSFYHSFDWTRLWHPFLNNNGLVSSTRKMVFLLAAKKSKYLWCEVIHASTFQKGDSRNAQYKYYCSKLNLVLAHFQIFHVAMEYMIFQHQAFHSHPGTSVVGYPLDFHPAIFYNCSSPDTLSFFLNSSLDTFQLGDLSSSFTFTLSCLQMSIWFFCQNNGIGCQLLLQGSYLSFLYVY